MSTSLSFRCPSLQSGSLLIPLILVSGAAAGAAVTLAKYDRHFFSCKKNGETMGAQAVSSVYARFQSNERLIGWSIRDNQLEKVKYGGKRSSSAAVAGSLIGKSIRKSGASIDSRVAISRGSNSNSHRPVSSFLSRCLSAASVHCTHASCMSGGQEKGETHDGSVHFFP